MTGTAPSRRLAAVGDARLSYLTAGPSDGEPVVLLHGMPTSAELWRPVMSRLADAGHRVLAPDLLGYGASGWRTGSSGHGLADSARLLGRWLDGLGSDGAPARPWLVGHDLGGGVAQILAVADPDRLAGLTLADAVFGDGWPVAPIRLLRAVARVGLYEPLCALRLGVNPATRLLIDRGLADPARVSPVRRAAVFWDGKVRDRGGRARFAAHLRDLDPADTAAVVGDLRDLPVPCQLIWAGRDRYLPFATVGEQLRAALPDPAVTVVDDAGHFLPLERPDAFAEALLAGIGAPRRGG